MHTSVPIASLQKDHRALFRLIVLSPYALAGQKHERTPQESDLKQKAEYSCIEAQQSVWLSFSLCSYTMQVSKKFSCIEAQGALWLSCLLCTIRTPVSKDWDLFTNLRGRRCLITLCGQQSPRWKQVIGFDIEGLTS